MNTTTRALLLCLAASTAAAHEPQAANPQQHNDRAPSDPFRLHPLAGNVHALYGRGGNIGFFVSAEAVVVIDSQFKDLGPGIVQKIKGITDRPIRYLLNTHHHGDHVGGNDAFKPFAIIIAHDNVRRRMLEQPATVLRDYPARIEEARASGNAAQVKSLSDALEAARSLKLEEIPAPVLTYDSEFRIHLGGETIELWHMPPAHTDGDSVVYFQKANVLHMGDDFFNKVIPFIDVRGGGSATGYLAMLDKVLARVPANATVIPGHGDVSDVAGLRAFRGYIADMVDSAKQAKAAGKTKEQYLKDVDLPAYRAYDGYGDRFKTNCAAAFDELK